METALVLESDEYGSSQLLVDENECHTLMDQARQSTFWENEILEIDDSTPSNPETLNQAMPDNSTNVDSRIIK